MYNYDEIFDWYATARSREIGIMDIEKFTSFLSPGSKILDLGCGDGFPIAKHLVAQGFPLFAIDSSLKMITKFRANFPDVPAEHIMIQDSRFFDLSFDAVIAYGVIFHLQEAEQEIVIRKVSDALAAGGRFLFTAQKDEINGTSSMNGITFPYISLGAEKYTKILHHAGLKLIEEYYDEWENYIYISEKA